MMKPLTTSLDETRARRRTAPALAYERVYLASRYARRDELCAIASDLETAGAEIVSGWLDSAQALRNEDLEPSGRAQALAETDFSDVHRATLLIAFTEPNSSPQGRGGRHVELGIALALGTRVVLVGPREHVFHCLPAVECFPTWAEARAALFRLPRDAAATA
jgi:hypothetical protein